MAGSLAYRTHQEAIWNGLPPVKYGRLLPYIHGKSILDFGAAEGVLSLMLADRDPMVKVVALEKNRERHDSALALQARWKAIGRRVDNCTMVLGSLPDRIDLLDGVETFVAIRSIYYLRDGIDATLAAVAALVPNVVLCGNAGRAQRWVETQGNPGGSLGHFNYYASREGMCAALEKAGYRVATKVREGDPIVTGHR